MKTKITEGRKPISEDHLYLWSKFGLKGLLKERETDGGNQGSRQDSKGRGFLIGLMCSTI